MQFQPLVAVAPAARESADVVVGSGPDRTCAGWQCRESVADDLGNAWHHERPEGEREVERELQLVVIPVVGSEPRGITHHWLENWLDLAGTKRFGAIWGRRPDGMPAFPRGLSAPTFLLDRLKKKSEFDRIDADQGWPQMIRRGFWLLAGAALGVTGYRKASRR